MSPECSSGSPFSLCQSITPMVFMAITTKEVVAIQSSVGSRETLEDQIFSVNKLDNPLVNLLLIAPLDL